ncbi:MAG TPA: CPBP family intramembrane glutamic endopeptidase [Caulobacteraceae bacterium]|nr:CPBP family intramembrane glutamic endopeptidase [Caulobacteraceae bacterium]
MGSVVAGLTAGLLASILATVAILIAYVVFTGAASQGPVAISDALSDLVSTDVHDVRRAVFVMLIPVFSNGPLALAAVAMAALLVRHRFRDYVTHARRIRWRLLLLGMAFCAVMMSPLVIAERLFDPNAPQMPVLSLSPDWLTRLVYAAAAILLLIPAAAAEELFFRGWLLRQTSAFVKRPLGLMLLNGAVFAALHFDFQPDSFLIRTLMGAGFSYMTLRLGGIEFSTGAHAANNILIVLFVEPLTLRTAIASGFSALTLVEMLLLAVGSVVITEIVVRLPAVRRWSGLREDDLHGPPTDPDVAPRFA